MPWPSNGDYYSFKEGVIARRAPAASGIYGVYNVQHHILISHSDNIRESLLRHNRETNFRFRCLEPSGFTFEVCPPEDREARFRRLAFEYQPILRPGETAGLRAWLRSWIAPGASAFSRRCAGEPRSEVAEHSPATPTAGDEESSAREQVRRDQCALAGSAFALLIAAMALIALLGENKNLTEIAIRKLLSVARYFTNLAEQDSPMAARASRQGTALAAGRRAPYGDSYEHADEASSTRRYESLEAKVSQRAAGMPGEMKIASPATLGDNPGEKLRDPAAGPVFRSWTVQALARPYRREAEAWRDELKAKGYDAFIVEAGIEGRLWYRVRIGPLAHIGEAEILAQTLRSKEGFQDAFLVPSTKPAVALASISR